MGGRPPAHPLEPPLSSPASSQAPPLPLPSWPPSPSPETPSRPVAPSSTRRTCTPSALLPSYLTHKTKSSEFRSNSNASSISYSSSSSVDSSWFGVWDGEGFRFKTLAPTSSSSSSLYRKIRPFLIDLLIFQRYGLSLLRMNRFRFVQKMLERFMLYYEGSESRPVFGTVEEMLKWSGLYGLTCRTLEKELADAGVRPLLMTELITVSYSLRDCILSQQLCDFVLDSD